MALAVICYVCHHPPSLILYSATCGWAVIKIVNLRIGDNYYSKEADACDTNYIIKLVHVYLADSDNTLGIAVI